MKYLLMIVLLFSFNQARAATVESLYTGNELLDRCEAYLSDTGSAAKGNTCFGYLAGIADAHDDFVAGGLHGKEWCKPENMKGKQLVRIVTKYLQEHPENLHYTAASLVANAFRKAFPCE